MLLMNEFPVSLRFAPVPGKNHSSASPSAGLSVHNAKMAPPKISFGIKCNHIAIRISDYHAASIEGAAVKHVHKDFQ